MKILDLGAGADSVARKLYPEAEVVTVDFDASAQPDVVADVRDLPEDLGEFDIVLASHLLEHLAHHEAVDAVDGWIRHVKPGGYLQVLVPDLMWAAERLVEANGIVDPAVNAHIYAGQQSAGRQHRSGYTTKLLRDLMQARGLWIRGIETAPFTIVMGDGRQVVSRQIVCLALRPAVEG